MAGLLERPDGRILAIYGKHGADQLQRWKITTKPTDISSWSDEKTLKTGAAYTYSNVYQLSEENNRIYNFSRSKGYNPNCTFSEDNGETWKYGWQLIHWAKSDYKNDPQYTHIDGSRPYLRYTSNNKGTIHFVTTEDHPQAYDYSIYHGFYSHGKLHDSFGKELNTPNAPDAKRLTPKSFTRVFEGGKNKVVWTTDNGNSCSWTAFTNNSTVDNLRPIIPSHPGKKRIILWCRGDLTNFNNYRLDIYGFTENR